MTSSPFSHPFEPSHAARRIVAGSLRPTNAPPSNLVSLAIGEPDFATPAPIVEAAVEALRGGFTHYPDFSGDPELRAVLAQTVSEIAGVTYSPQQIFCTHGGTAGVSAAILAAVNPGDRVVIPEPSYSLYADTVNFAGGVPVFVRTTDDYHLDLDAIEARLPGARMIVICNPCNPTGAVYGRAEMTRLAELVERYDVLLLSDEAYYSLVYDGREFPSALAFPQLHSRLIYAQTFSKTYAMTGWRCGYVAAPPDIIKAIGFIHRTFNGTGNAAVQRAALAAARIGPSLADPMRAEYMRRRDIMMAEVERTPHLHARPPEGTFYLFARYDLDIPSTELLARLLEGGVAMRAGIEYGPGGEHHLRFSFAVSTESIAEGFRRVRATFERLRLPSLTPSP